MFEITYNELINNYLFSNFTINYMPGLKVLQFEAAKAMLNITTKTAYIYV